MTTSSQTLNNLENSPQFHIAPKPYVLQSRELHRRQSPAAELLQENNSLLSSRINGSLLAPAAIPRIGNSSGCRGLKRERAPTAVSVRKDSGNFKSESEILSMEGIKALNSKPPLFAGQGAAKENQGRCQAPMRMRKNNSMAEPKSAILPSSSTGKLIERSRQKVAEKHASKDFGTGVSALSLVSTLTEREGTGNQQDQLLSMIELTKNSLYKDQKMIRHCLNKHKKAAGSLEQKCYEKSFEGRKI